MEFVDERSKVSGSKLFREQILTVNDLLDFKNELPLDIKRLLEAQAAQPARKWLKSYEVEKLLGISPGTLQTFRNNGTIPYTKIGGGVNINQITRYFNTQENG